MEHLTLQLSAGDDFGSTPTASGGGGGGDAVDASLVNQLTDMGFSADQAKVALQACVRPPPRTTLHDLSVPHQIPTPNRTTMWGERSSSSSISSAVRTIKHLPAALFSAVL